jgi:transposase
VLTLPSSVRVFLAMEPVDMRGSFDALAGHTRRLALDPQDGHLYVFLNRRRDRVT